jgi:hypothetical protein
MCHNPWHTFVLQPSQIYVPFLFSTCYRASRRPPLRDRPSPRTPGVASSAGGDHPRRRKWSIAKSELSKAMMDRDWPHQVALPAYRCMGLEYLTIHIFCQAERLSLCRRHHSYRQNDIDMTVFCFAEREHADQFQARFAAVNSWGRIRDQGGQERAHGTQTSPQSTASITDTASIAMTDMRAHEFAQCFLAIFAACKAAIRSGPAWLREIEAAAAELVDGRRLAAAASPRIRRCCTGTSSTNA